MDISLEKIDTVVSRTNVSFSKAKEALEKNNGDVIDAIVFIEENEENWAEDISIKSEDLFGKIKDIIKEGNVTKIIIKRSGKTILNLPVTFAAAGAILAIKPAILGLGVAVLAKCTIEIVKEDGEIIEIENPIIANSQTSKETRDESFDKGQNKSNKDI